MSERIELSSSRSGVECLFVEQGGKKMGGGRPPKNIVQERREKEKERERESNRVVSVWA